MTALAPVDAGLLHRPADRSARARARTRSPPTATPSGCCCASPPNAPASRPARLDIADLDAPLIAAFLDHLEHDRRNSDRDPQQPARGDPLAVRLPRAAPPRTRRIDPARARDPAKRTERNLLTYLTDPEVDALLDACDQTTWTGRRDHAMLRAHDPDRAADLRARSRSPARHHAHHRRQRPHHRQREEREDERRSSRRSERCSKPGSASAPALPTEPLFPTTTGKRLSRDAIERRLAHPPRNRRRQLPVAARPSTSRCTRSGTPPRCACCSPATTSP